MIWNMTICICGKVVRMFFGLKLSAIWFDLVAWDLIQCFPIITMFLDLWYTMAYCFLTHFDLGLYLVTSFWPVNSSSDLFKVHFHCGVPSFTLDKEVKDKSFIIRTASASKMENSGDFQDQSMDLGGLSE